MDTNQHQLPARPPFLPRVLDDLLTVRWAPDRTTLVVLGSYLLVFIAMGTAFQLVTPGRALGHFVTFGVITLAGLGIAFPVFYTVLVRRRPLADLGLTTTLLIPSLILGILLGIDSYRNTIATLNIRWTMELAPYVAAALAVGLFEAIFFAGWLQLRLEAAFGLIPGLVLTVLAYSFYHLGYGVPREELGFLFGTGLVFGIVFRATKNVAVLWPFFTPVEGVCTFQCQGVTFPATATYSFGLVLALMLSAVIVAVRVSKKDRSRAEPGSRAPRSSR